MSPVALPKKGAMTQGTVFTCATSEDYSDCDVYGIVITARCDVAHSKARKYNYVPIVPFSDWMIKEGRYILSDRVSADAMNAMRNCLRDAGYTVSVLETIEPERIREELFSAGGKNNAGFNKRFAEALKKFTDARNFVDSKFFGEELLKFFYTYEKQRDIMVSELVAQKLPGYYFLAQVEPDGEDNGFVALLREVRHMPRLLADHLSRGLNYHGWKELCSSNAEFQTRLSLRPNTHAMPVSIIESPHIEHFMQTFSNMFTRIGLKDVESNYVSSLWDRQWKLKVKEQ